MRDVNSRLYLFSAGEFHKEILHTLAAIGYKPCEVTGKYFGQQEKAIAIASDNMFERLLMELLDWKRQENYLVVYTDRSAELVDKDNRSFIGKWTEVADPGDGDYSLVNGVYYVVQ